MTTGLPTAAPSTDLSREERESNVHEHLYQAEHERDEARAECERLRGELAAETLRANKLAGEISWAWSEIGSRDRGREDLPVAIIAMRVANCAEAHEDGRAEGIAAERARLTSPSVQNAAYQKEFGYPDALCPEYYTRWLEAAIATPGPEATGPEWGDVPIPVVAQGTIKVEVSKVTGKPLAEPACDNDEVRNCTRKKPHDGPCNGWRTPECPHSIASLVTKHHEEIGLLDKRIDDSNEAARQLAARVAILEADFELFTNGARDLFAEKDERLAALEAPVELPEKAVYGDRMNWLADCVRLLAKGAK